MEALMSFGIQGPKGDTGARGPSGATGPQGPAGPSGFNIVRTTSIPAHPDSTASNVLFGIIGHNGTYGAQSNTDIVYRGLVAWWYHTGSNWVYTKTAPSSAQLSSLTYVFKMTVTSSGYLSFTDVKGIDTSNVGNFGYAILIAQSS